MMPASADVRFPGRAATCWRVALVGRFPARRKIDRRGSWFPIIVAPTPEDAFARARAIYPDAELLRAPLILHERH